MSLKVRIDLLFGLILLLGLAADIGRMVLNARARVQAESAAMTMVTRDLVEAAMGGLRGAPDPEAALRNLAASLDTLRHIRVVLVHDPADAAAAALVPEDIRRKAPDWFADLIHARNELTILPAAIDGRSLGAVVIASDPADEINEVWQEARNLALTGGGIALAALVGASFVLGRTLQPLRSCADALGRLRDGDYAARVESAGSPEFVDLCAKINALAEALQRLSADNRSLIQRLMDVQEDERKTIAHELHDEIGPHLFALRANATVLEAGLKQNGPEPLQRRAAAVSAAIEALQGHNKRILRQLRPPALDELGLSEALKILVQSWCETDPSVDLELCLPERLGPLDEREGLALYRIAQEALTNVHRHARATHASVVLTREDSPAAIRLRVQDDGIGIDPAQPAGLGLAGMRERVRAVGGHFSFGNAPGGGGLVEAFLPRCHAEPKQLKVEPN
jgi:two-component system, NarL family, sensor histidine kinase UhpB